jgi:hypothetical protein
LTSAYAVRGYAPAAAVRNASVRSGLGRPRTGAATATDGTGGSGYADRQLHDSSTEPKLLLCGQTRILDFARNDPVATQNEVRDCHGDAAYWQFRSVPHPVKAR